MFLPSSMPITKCPPLVFMKAATVFITACSRDLFNLFPLKSHLNDDLNSRDSFSFFPKRSFMSGVCLKILELSFTAFKLFRYPTYLLASGRYFREKILPDFVFILR